MKTILSSYVTLIIMGAISNASAEVRISGYFIARSECPAYQSFRSQTNPGNVSTEIDKAYDLIAKNKELATHYRIKINAVPKQRWVALSCGEHVVPVGKSSPPGQQPPDSAAEKYILAISWQSGFCEIRPSKPECQSQNENRFDATNFTLHGLWPQPRTNIYCNVAPEVVAVDKAKKWGNLPALILKDETRADLNLVMPGSQSNLHRHEWIKHGTCYDGGPSEEYYNVSIRLMSELNNSAIRNLFVDNLGNEITSTQIREAFDNSFGEGAGDKIKIVCKNDGSRRLITELTIGLKGNLDESTLGNAILRAPSVNNAGCNKGIVDRVGLQ